MTPTRRWLAVAGVLAVDAFAPPRALRGDLEEELGPESLIGPPLTHQWQLVHGGERVGDGQLVGSDEIVGGEHWQVVSEGVEDVAATDAAEQTTGGCPPGMVEIKGNRKFDRNSWSGALEESQEATCMEWISHEFPERCAKFDRGRWLAVSSELPTEPEHFCIDRFEYPNRRGAYPWVLVTWHEASSICASEGKRLCTESEWTFACEGPEGTPYPYGYARDEAACVIDRPWRQVEETAFARRTDLRALRELDRLWQGEASGSRPGCRSAFGVYDMTGNVDEWAASSRHGERPSVLKGGYWGPVRAICSASTRAHDADFAFYQIGFRCCADAPSPSPPGDGGDAKENP
jgi:hypothetical protein